MYCKFCGKEIGEDSQFCPYCGGKLNDQARMENRVDLSSVAFYVQKFVDKANMNKLLLIIMAVFSTLSVVVRLTKQQIISVRYGLVYDDYYVITSAGRGWIIFFIIAQVAALFILCFLGIKNKKALNKSTYIISAVALLLEVLLIVVRFPAPY